MNVKNHIKELREARGMTLQDLADKMGVNRATVFRWEQGTRLPTLDKLPALAYALGVSLSALYEPATLTAVTAS